MDGFLHVTMVDGSTHHMPWKPIRDSYFDWYGSTVSEPNAIRLAEWFDNAMTWQEVSPHLIAIKKAEPNYKQTFNAHDFISRANH